MYADHKAVAAQVCGIRPRAAALGRFLGWRFPFANHAVFESLIYVAV
jgi:predicted MFS family arabinose efflux permease